MPPWGLYLEGRVNGGFFFCVTGLGGLYLERLIHGGAYFRNFTIFASEILSDSPSDSPGYSKQRMNFTSGKSLSSRALICLENNKVSLDSYVYSKAIAREE